MESRSKISEAVQPRSSKTVTVYIPACKLTTESVSFNAKNKRVKSIIYF